MLNGGHAGPLRHAGPEHENVSSFRKTVVGDVLYDLKLGTSQTTQA